MAVISPPAREWRLFLQKSKGKRLFPICVPKKVLLWNFLKMFAGSIPGQAHSRQADGHGYDSDSDNDTDTDTETEIESLSF
jgi:hypothetical protein